MTAHQNGPQAVDAQVTDSDEPRCAYCAQPDGFWNRHLVLNPPAYRGPMHKECMADIARWGCD